MGGGLPDALGSPCTDAGTGGYHLALDHIAGGAPVVGDQPGPALVESGRQVLLPQLVGLEHMAVHVDHQMIRHAMKLTPLARGGPRRVASA